jgi:hypothetical protein
VHTLASEIHILEDDTLIAVHPVLEGRGQRPIAGGCSASIRMRRRVASCSAVVGGQW